MATGLLAILDDVSMLMDDVAAMSKVAGRKTAGLLGDDLAVNAEKATGFQASRELPVLWAITKGSFINKLIILPLAFVLSSFASWAIIPILLLGGAYLCYEGVEKIVEVLFHRKHPANVVKQKQTEKQKIRAAIRTDFILSIEIIIIALETVIDQSLTIQVSVVSLIAVVATIGVYGLVALMVRMDDTGLWLIARGIKRTGRLLVSALPLLVKGLSIIGTVAMLLVGGGIYVHNLAVLHPLVIIFPSLLSELVTGLGIGVVIVMVMSLYHRLVDKSDAEQS